MELTSDGHVSEDDSIAVLKYLNTEHAGFKTFVASSQQVWSSFKYQVRYTTPLFNSSQENRLWKIILEQWEMTFNTTFPPQFSTREAWKSRSCNVYINKPEVACNSGKRAQGANGPMDESLHFLESVEMNLLKVLNEKWKEIDNEGKMAEFNKAITQK